MADNDYMVLYRKGSIIGSGTFYVSRINELIPIEEVHSFKLEFVKKYENIDPILVEKMINVINPHRGKQEPLLEKLNKLLEENKN